MPTQRRISLRMLTTFIAASSAVVLVAACSSSGGGSSKSSSAPAGSGSSSSAAANPNAIPEAKAAFDKLVTRPAKIPVTVPIGAPIPKGKVIDWIECGVPECTVLTPPLKDAAAALGWTIKVVPAGLTPETILNAWNVAVRDKPDGVIGTGFPVVLFKAPLAQLKAAGIPVVYGFVTDPVGDGIIAMINATEGLFNPTGKAMADVVLGGDTGNQTNVLFIGQSTFPGAVLEGQTFKDEYTKLCPACPYDTINPPATASGTTLASDLVAYLTKHPKVNYVVATSPSQLVGLPQALKTAGIKVGLLTNSPDQTTVQYLADGQISGIMMDTQNDAMWQMMDAMARHFAGVDVTPSQAPSPNWVVTKATAAQLTSPYFLVPNFAAQFKALWGVS
jgi:ABC-type sugar transport system substrate-binding protein